jgi:hypothetical protein
MSMHVNLSIRRRRKQRYIHILERTKKKGILLRHTKRRDWFDDWLVNMDEGRIASTCSLSGLVMADEDLINKI